MLRKGHFRLPHLLLESKMELESKPNPGDTENPKALRIPLEKVSTGRSSIPNHYSLNSMVQMVGRWVKVFGWNGCPSKNGHLLELGGMGYSLEWMGVSIWNGIVRIACFGTEGWFGRIARYGFRWLGAPAALFSCKKKKKS
ncbi:hypothetical protein Nepgr_029733 [Nepenthes gracilis]|uniref:Uncharacterized protein n=1 Tax=Nepenthes gracilis TaxID=150966 RepID=A0AAD3TD52_NEPGR|nr:hypothetical protein Nepgr_029733 [Nepenthes gracilis]